MLAEKTWRATYKVPSVGIEPPIPVPTQKSAQQSQPNEGAKAAAPAKTAVMARVRLKAGTRPFASETAFDAASAHACSLSVPDTKPTAAPSPGSDLQTKFRRVKRFVLRREDSLTTEHAD
jgi:hypothetical protein